MAIDFLAPSSVFSHRHLLQARDRDALPVLQDLHELHRLDQRVLRAGVPATRCRDPGRAAVNYELDAQAAGLDYDQIRLLSETDRISPAPGGHTTVSTVPLAVQFAGLRAAPPGGEPDPLTQIIMHALGGAVGLPFARPPVDGRSDRARRTLRGIDEQVATAEQAVAGQTPVKRNRFIRLSGGTRTVNRELEDKARAVGLRATWPTCGPASRAPRSRRSS